MKARKVNIGTAIKELKEHLKRTQQVTLFKNFRLEGVYEDYNQVKITYSTSYFFRIRFFVARFNKITKVWGILPLEKDLDRGVIILEST